MPTDGCSGMEQNPSSSTSGRTTAQWVELGKRVNTPIAPVNTPQTIADDPQFRERLPWLGADRFGADLLPTPIKLVEEELPVLTRAPTPGQHTEEILRHTLGYDDVRIDALRSSGALG